jgi:hypothetical protein
MEAWREGSSAGDAQSIRQSYLDREEKGTPLSPIARWHAEAVGIARRFKGPGYRGMVVEHGSPLHHALMTPGTVLPAIGPTAWTPIERLASAYVEDAASDDPTHRNRSPLRRCFTSQRGTAT